MTATPDTRPPLPAPAILEGLPSAEELSSGWGTSQADLEAQGFAIAEITDYPLPPYKAEDLVRIKHALGVFAHLAAQYDEENTKKVFFESADPAANNAAPSSRKVAYMVRPTKTLKYKIPPAGPIIGSIV